LSFSKTHRKIAILSHCGTKNLGDESLFAAVMQNVLLRIPKAVLLGFTMNPEDTSQRHGIPCFPVRRLEHSRSMPTSPPESSSSSDGSTQKIALGMNKFKKIIGAIPGVRPLFSGFRSFVRSVLGLLAEPKFLLDSYRRLRGVELLLVSGGQQLNDAYGGAWGFPFTLYKWTLLSKLTGTKVALLCVGAGPVDSSLSKFFVRRLLNNVDYRSYRDDVSSRFVENLGVKGRHPVFPDLVYSLQLPAPKSAPAGSQRTVVAANPVPFFDGRYWPTHDSIRYQDYVSKFARFAEWLDQTGHAVLLFPTQARADVYAIDDIRQAMNGSSQSPNILHCNKIDTLQDLVTEISRADFVVANRYHGILISLMMNKPVLGIAYAEKSRALLEQVGQAEYALDISDFTTENLIERLRSMEENAPAIRRKIADSIAPFRKALDEQYDTVLGLIGVSSATPRVTCI
jgi:polysaccharide pyruvyl transferase WcaK-like protein